MTRSTALDHSNMRWRLRWVAGLIGVLSLIGCSQPAERTAAQPWSDARQLVLVTVPGWDSSTGTLQSFNRMAGKWRPASAPAPVTVGRSGSAWGLGLHGGQTGQPKREGDGRSPAGAFRIGDAFGYDPSVTTGLSYLPMKASHYCIDVSDSPLYNQIVDTDDVGETAARGSTEPMRLDIHGKGDQRYHAGFIIEHNASGQPMGGSCIFAHEWKSPADATSGCTAMARDTMASLLAWLDADSRPVFVLLPEAEYDRLQAEWNLPPRKQS